MTENPQPSLLPEEIWIYMGAASGYTRILREGQNEVGAVKYIRADLTPSPTIRELARKQPCGCQVCYCEDEAQCHGCGAKRCHTPECVIGSDAAVYTRPTPAMQTDEVGEDERLDYESEIKQLRAVMAGHRARIADLVAENEALTAATEGRTQEGYDGIAHDFLTMQKALEDIAGLHEVDGNSMECDSHEECQYRAKKVLDDLKIVPPTEIVNGGGR